MLKVITGLHYGRNSFKKLGKGQYLWLSLRPFHWFIDGSVLSSQHKSHSFKNDWLEKYSFATAKDHPQNNAVFVTNISKGVSAEHIAGEYKLEPVLRFKSPKAYKSLKKRFIRMLNFGASHHSQKRPSDNVIVYSNKHHKTHYMFENR